MRLWPKRFTALPLTPQIALLSVLALVLAGVLATLYQDRLYREQKIEEVTVQARILAASVTAALLFKDNEAAQEYVAALRANPGLEAASVYDSNRLRVAGFTRMGAMPPPQDAEIQDAHVEDNNIIVVLPAEQDGMIAGTVYLRATLEPFPLRLLRYGGVMLLLAMGGLALAVSIVAQRALAGANRKLESQARELFASNVKLQNEIVERSKAEQALRQSQKMEAIGQLSGGIAHDFNNLITIIGGNLRLLARRTAEGRPEIQHYLDAAMEALNRAGGLTQRVLAFSRQQPLSPRPVDLNELLNGMRDLVRHSVGDTVQVEMRLQAHWEIHCDAHQMETVILNLAINARDAMPAGGTLMIATQDQRMGSGALAGNYVKLIVRDTGIGMSEDVRQRAIDPFFTTKPLGRGTGLGLSMAFGFVQQSEGHFEIESEPGKGTTVTILMPRYEVPTMQAVS